MKSTQLLSVVFSLIMFTGISAGSVAFADEDDLEDRLEEFCEITAAEQRVFFSDFPEMAEYDEKLSAICGIDDPSEQSNSLEDFIEVVYEIKDEDDDYEDFDEEFEELEEEIKEMDNDRDEYEAGDDDDYDRDYVRDARHYDLDERLEYFCEMTDEEKRQFFEDHPRMEQFSDRLENYCELSEDEREKTDSKILSEII